MKVQHFSLLYFPPIQSNNMNTSLSLFSLLSLFLFYFLSLPSPSLSELCNPKDKKVLLQIKQSLNNPYYWISWYPDQDCCTYWNSVECDENTHRITSLDISYDNVSGQIPAGVGNLPYLKYLVFRKLPNLNGQIPSAISKLSHLRYVSLSWTNLTGPVPTFFSQLKNLDYLDLSFNQLTGSIPPSLSLLPILRVLHLDRNRLTGNIPDSFGNFAGEVPDLHLSHNQLTGSVPKSFGRMNFTRIDLSRNKLEGDISFLFGANKPMQVGDFSRNLFKFNFSKVEEFPVDLIYLDLNHNGIYGSLPLGLTAIGLQSFNVSYNRLCGQIPTGGKLRSFDYSVYFHNRCLCGAPLPAC